MPLEIADTNLLESIGINCNCGSISGRRFKCVICAIDANNRDGECRNCKCTWSRFFEICIIKKT
jgi:hypothetical protein